MANATTKIDRALERLTDDERALLMQILAEKQPDSDAFLVNNSETAVFVSDWFDSVSEAAVRRWRTANVA